MQPKLLQVCKAVAKASGKPMGSLTTSTRSVVNQTSRHISTQSSQKSSQQSSQQSSQHPKTLPKSPLHASLCHYTQSITGTSSFKIRSAGAGASGVLIGGMFSWLTGDDDKAKNQPSQQNQQNQPNQQNTENNTPNTQNDQSFKNSNELPQERSKLRTISVPGPTVDNTTNHNTIKSDAQRESESYSHQQEQHDKPSSQQPPQPSPQPNEDKLAQLQSSQQQLHQKKLEIEKKLLEKQNEARNAVSRSPIVTTTLNSPFSSSEGHRDDDRLSYSNTKEQNANKKMLDTTYRQSQSDDFHNEIVISDLSELAFELPPTQRKAYEALNPPTAAQKRIRNEYNDKASQLSQMKKDKLVHKRPADDIDEFREYYNLNREISDLEDELPESKIYLENEENMGKKHVEYNWGERDESIYTPKQRAKADSVQKKRSKQNEKSDTKMFSSKTFQFDHYQAERARQHFLHVQKVREKAKKDAIARRKNDTRSLATKALDIDSIDEFDVEGYPGGNKWDSEYSGIEINENEVVMDEIDWMNPSQIDFDNAITLVEKQFNLPFSALLRSMPMEELQDLIIKEVAKLQWYWIEDEQDTQRMHLLQEIQKAIQAGRFDDIYDIPGLIPPPLEYPEYETGVAIAQLTDKQKELMNGAMHIMTSSYFGDINSQLETQRYSLDMIQYFERRRAAMLDEHEKRYMKRRDYHLNRFTGLQSERNEILRGKKNFDLAVINNMEQRLANKALWRQQREELGLEIEYDQEIDQKIDDVVETRFEAIKSTSKLLKKIQEQEEEMEKEMEKATLNGTVINNDLMLEIDSKINKLLEELNEENGENDNGNEGSKKRIKIIIPGKNLGDLKLDELVEYNRLKAEYHSREKQFDDKMVEFLEDERAFRFQLNDNELRQSKSEEFLRDLDDEFIDLIDSLYIEEKSKIASDLQSNLFDIFDFTTRSEQYQYLSTIGIIDPLPPPESLIQPSRTEIEANVRIIDSIFGNPKEDFFFFDEVRNTLKRISPTEHSALQLRPPPSDPAVEQYRALRRAAYYRSNGPNGERKSKENSLDVLLARVEAKDPTLTPDQFSLVKDFILNPHKYDGAEFNYPLLALQDDPLRYKDMSDYGLSAGEVYADLIDEGYKLFNTPAPPRSSSHSASVLSPTGDVTDMYSPEQLQRMLIVDEYEQVQRKKERRTAFSQRMKRHNQHLAQDNYHGFHFDLIQPYDPFYLSMGYPVEERGGEPPSFDQLAKFHATDKPRKLPYFYNVEMDAMYALPLNHFESYYTSFGPQGDRDVEVFPVYFGTDYELTDASIASMTPIANLPTVLNGLDYIDMGSMTSSLDYLKKL